MRKTSLLCMTWLLTSSLLFVTAGCGSSETGPDRFRVSGEVTFDGKPVPAGSIDFETANGPPGGAQIVNGKFDTNSGKGVVGGPHSVVIQGFDGNGANPGELGQPIFKPFRIEFDFPKEESTHQFEVPASAAEGLIISNDPA